VPHAATPVTPVTIVTPSVTPVPDAGAVSSPLRGEVTVMRARPDVAAMKVAAPVRCPFAVAAKVADPGADADAASHQCSPAERPAFGASGGVPPTTGGR